MIALLKPMQADTPFNAPKVEWASLSPLLILLGAGVFLLVAATTVVEQVMGLARAGVEEFHFYTNNRADMVFAVCHLLGVRPVREKVDA